MSATATLTKTEAPSRQKGKSRRAEVVAAPLIAQQGRSLPRQRECLSDWNHAS